MKPLSEPMESPEVDHRFSGSEDSLVLCEPSVAAVRDIVCNEISANCVKAVGDGLRAIVMTGSMARDESTITDGGGGKEVLGDAEFLLIFNRDGDIVSAQEFERLKREIENKLLQAGVQCHICLAPVTAQYLSRIKPHIFGYELRNRGVVIWGDRDVLSLIPGFSVQDIPLEDGVRILCNRMLEHVEIASELPVSSREFRYATVKLYLDMATSFLVFVGDYRPTYRERLGELKKLGRAGIDSGRGLPFSLHEFAREVELCTRWKLFPNSSLFEDAPGSGGGYVQFLRNAVQLAHSLWRWELEQLLGIAEGASNEQLLAAWADSQTWSSYLRGWVRVLRDSGRQEGRHNWKRWLRLGRHWSPRCCIYAAGCQLFFQLPELLQTERSAELGQLRNLSLLLPVYHRAQMDGCASEWRDLAGKIARNYHEFLETTRT